MYALKESMLVDDMTRLSMGAKGRQLIEEKYTWNAIVNTILNGYERLLRG